MIGSLPLLYAVALLFIAANLAVGITFSTLAKNQLQAVQMAFFFFLPSILLSGFMFPFRGMPEWAQWLGSILPNTHFLRIARGILLKGNGPLEIAPEIWVAVRGWRISAWEPRGPWIMAPWPTVISSRSACSAKSRSMKGSILAMVSGSAG